MIWLLGLVCLSSYSSSFSSLKCTTCWSIVWLFYLTEEERLATLLVFLVTELFLEPCLEPFLETIFAGVLLGDLEEDFSDILLGDLLGEAVTDF